MKSGFIDMRLTDEELNRLKMEDYKKEWECRVVGTTRKTMCLYNKCQHPRRRSCEGCEYLVELDEEGRIIRRDSPGDTMESRLLSI